MEPDRLPTIPQAIERLRMSRTRFFPPKRQGVITDIRLGFRTLIPAREVVRLIDERYRPPMPKGDE